MSDASFSQVVDSGCCVGCGACEVATGGSVTVRLGPTRTYQADPDVSLADSATASSVCPFADETVDETALGARLYPELPEDPRTGRYLAGYAGRNPDAALVPDSSSGGLTSYLLRSLLERGDVDGIIHVGETGAAGGSGEPIFAYVVSNDVDQLMARRKSQYYPVSMNEVLREVRGDGRHYAFVGIPCVVTAVRHLMAQDPVLQEQLRFVVGIVCGHLKSIAYAESFAWQLGIAPDALEKVDFRVKDPERTSREYGFAAVDATGHREERKTLSLVGGSWGHAVFQLGACDFCDDIFAESADVVFGDAWLSKYEIDWRGTNVVLTRDRYLDSILTEARTSGAIELDDLTMDKVAETQGGNFRHRRDGLAVRLADDRAAGRWTPRKRVQPDTEHLPADRVDLIRDRREITRESHVAFESARRAGDLGVYLDRMRPLIERYQSRTSMPFRTRLRNKLRRETYRVLSKLRTARSNRKASS
ncbi:Coenzyme F420 hydrogenase/dehydrogenase, beta subunit C-terminal domain [Nocardioides zeae]|nr:Coenzyme F420 hydrogenase/dehydrogenase, beta subunit C-terminal domain [Nocardioides zeae]